MEKMTCENCGAPLDRSGTCHYCGTHYRIEQDKFVVVHSGPAQTVRAEAHLSRQLLDMAYRPEQAVDQTLHDLRRSLADALMGYMVIRKEYDPSLDVEIFKGEVRVVPPGYRF